MKTGAELIAEERQRQIEREGWTPEHDDWHSNYELSEAACCYANMASGGPFSHPTQGNPPAEWPWEPEWWKPSRDPVRNLVKAGALIAAEIDRLQRRPERECESEADDSEPTMSFTAGYLIERGLWNEACEVLGLNEWAVKEGQLDRSEFVHMTEAQARKIGVVAN